MRPAQDPSQRPHRLFQNCSLRVSSPLRRSISNYGGSNKFCRSSHRLIRLPRCRPFRKSLNHLTRATLSVQDKIFPGINFADLCSRRPHLFRACLQPVVGRRVAQYLRSCRVGNHSSLRLTKDTHSHSVPKNACRHLLCHWRCFGDLDKRHPAISGDHVGDFEGSDGLHAQRVVVLKFTSSLSDIEL